MKTTLHASHNQHTSNMTTKNFTSERIYCSLNCIKCFWLNQITPWPLSRTSSANWNNLGLAQCSHQTEKHCEYLYKCQFLLINMFFSKSDIAFLCMNYNIILIHELNHLSNSLISNSIFKDRIKYHLYIYSNLSKIIVSKLIFHIKSSFLNTYA